MKLVLIYTYGEPYEVGYHDSITPMEYESPEKLYYDICEAFNKKDYPTVIENHEFYLDKECFDSIRIYTLEEFWENYQP